MTAVSVIIPTRNRPIPVVDAVRSVFSSTFQDFELFVIDTSDGEASCEALAPFRADRRFRYHRNTSLAGGAASSRNLGIVLSRGDLLAMTDDDVTVRPDWLANIAAEFAADPALQFICGRLTAPPDDTRAGFTPAFDAAPGLKPLQMPAAAAGANFSMRRALLERVGGYDEIWGPGSRLGFSDDGDLSWRVARSGAKWRACPHVEVVHTHGHRPPEAAAALLKQYQRGLGANFGRFVRRGDAVALWYFTARLAADVARGLGHLARGRRGVGLGWACDRAVGFARAFALPPRRGFVSGPDLVRRRRALAPSSGALLEIWGRALLGGHADLNDPRDAVVRELSEYFRLPAEEVRERCRHWEDDSLAEWQARDRSTPEGLLDFYRTQTSWIFDTMWYHAAQYHGEQIAESVLIARSLSHLPPGRHLDFGAGPGSSSLFFQALGWETSLADVSTTMLDFARWRLSRHGAPADFYDPSRQELPPAAFDLVTAFDVFVHVPDIPATLALLHRAMRPGGLLVFNIDNRPKSERNAPHLYSEQYPILAQVRRAGFERLPKIDFFHVYRKVERAAEANRRAARWDALRYNAVVAASTQVVRRLRRRGG